MAGVGRGRGATLPAWMLEQQAADALAASAGRGEHISTSGNGNGVASNGHGAAPTAAQGQYEDVRSVSGHRDERGPEKGPSRSRDRDRDSRDRGGGGSSRRSRRSISRSSSPRGGSRRDRDRDHRRDRSHSSRRDRDRERSRDRSRDGGSGSGGGGWKPRGKDAKSNFDVRPAPGSAPLPPGVGAAAASSGGGLAGMMPMGDGGSMSSQMQMSKHARRLYVGGVPPTMSEQEVASYFNDTITRAILPARLDSAPVLSVFLNKDKCFAFVEVTTIELATACSQLDGIVCNMSNPPATLRIRRPNDYRPEQVPTNLPPAPVFNLSALGIVSTTVADGPNKVFVGGLPYHLSEENVKELLSAFGSLKSFHLVKEAGSTTSKGYGFCEYSDVNVMHGAVVALNGMAIGDKTLTVRLNDRVPQPLSFPPGQSFVPPPPLPLLATQPATRVLLLKNIVTRNELQDDSEFEDIQEDVKGECSSYGTVECVIIPREKEGYNLSAEGSVYVSYINADMARAAALALSGRKFAERVVTVEYYDENDFASRVLV